MSNMHLSSIPNNPYEWNESVLSTRSLSYLSVDAMGSPGHPPSGGMTHGRPSATYLARQARRQDTMTDSDAGLEMGETHHQNDRELNDIPELPDSVADSLLFTFPREIRDKIYQFCLTAQDNKPVEWPTARKAFGLQPQLLRLCKIIYNEAGQLLYTLNNLTFHHPSDANMFVRAATSPTLARGIASLSLHIRAQDTRLWMPYLTSKDSKRSLKADFPALRDLNVRFRSNKWQHALSPDANMKLWSEDPRLEEAIAILRYIFLPDTADPKTTQEFETYVSNHPEQFPLDPSDDEQYKKQWLAIQSARHAFAAKRASTPSIRVVCACRLHSAHFAALTGTGLPVVPPIAPHLLLANNPAVVPPPPGVDPNRPVTPPTAVKDGESFRGFTSLDLRHGIRKLQDPDLGSANVARTPFAEKQGVLIALEVHCLDRRANEGERVM